MKKTNRDIFTVMELSGAGVKGSSLELFTAARTITGKTGGQVIAVVIGHGTDEAVKTAAACAPGRDNPRGRRALCRIQDSGIHERAHGTCKEIRTGRRYGVRNEERQGSRTAPCKETRYGHNCQLHGAERRGGKRPDLMEHAGSRRDHGDDTLLRHSPADGHDMPRRFPQGGQRTGSGGRDHRRDSGGI